MTELGLLVGGEVWWQGAVVSRAPPVVDWRGAFLGRRVVFRVYESSGQKF